MRLIDADKLETHEQVEPLGNGKYEYVEVVYKDDIDNAPTIEPERKTGKWIEFPIHMVYKCSECGRIIQTTDGQRNILKHYPFCHCGADMRGEEDEIN